MSKYLVTGAAGFIGRRVTEMLCAEGHLVIGIDSLNDSYDVRMKPGGSSNSSSFRDFTSCTAISATRRHSPN